MIWKLLVLKPRFHDQSFPSKTLSKKTLTKKFDHVNLHQKFWSNTLKHFDGLWRNRTSSYFSKNFDGLWWKLTNQNMFRIFWKQKNVTKWLGKKDAKLHNSNGQMNRWFNQFSGRERWFWMWNQQYIMIRIKGRKLYGKFLEQSVKAASSSFFFTRPYIIFSLVIIMQFLHILLLKITVHKMHTYNVIYS